MQIGKQEKPWGIKEPHHDKEIIDDDGAGSVSIKFYKNNSLIGTKSIVTSGTRTTITVTLV